MARDNNRRRKEVREKQLKQEKRSAKRGKEEEAARKQAMYTSQPEGFSVHDAPFGKVVVSHDPDRMNSITIGRTTLYRPRPQAELAVRIEAEAAFRAKHPPAVHTDRLVINPILQDQFAHHDAKLKAIVPQIASRHMMEMILYQYDQTCEIDGAAKAGTLSPDDLSPWEQIGPEYRRAIKYVAECIVMAAADEAPVAPQAQQLELLDRVVIAAEELVRYAGLSDQTFGLFPENTTLTIGPPGTLDYLTLDVHPRVGEDMQQRARADLAVRGKYVATDFPLFDPDIRRQTLDPAFVATFGMAYEACMSVLATSINAFEPAPNGFPIPFVLRQQMIDRWSAQTGVDKAKINQLFAGFSLNKIDLDGEGRVVWRPKQEYRAYRRAFFEMPHATGPHLTWSPGMAEECLFLLMRDLAFQKFPPEWRNQDMQAAVAELSNRCGVAFERRSHELLRERGFVAARSYKDGIGMGAARVAIPPGVGEIDCLGYHPDLRLLVVLEKKLVQPGTEPIRLRDDLSQFQGPKGFLPSSAKS